MPYCEKCGNQISAEAIFCRNCGEKQGEINNRKVVKNTAQPLSLPKAPIAGGVMIIMGAIFCMIVYMLFKAYLDDRNRGIDPDQQMFLLIQMIAFLVGLLCGTLAISRKYFIISVLGAFIVVIGGFIGLFMIFLGGLITLILGVLGLIFIALSKDDFKKSPNLFDYPE